MKSHTRKPVSMNEWLLMLVASGLLVAATNFRWWNVGFNETLGFATGGACVWLIVRDHIANWPIGLANNVFFFALFLNARLYADMWLQVVYFALGIYGWWNWVRGGKGETKLTVTRATRRERALVPLGVGLSFFLMWYVLIQVGGASPVWDSLTTALCLGAQYLCCRKRFEHWFLWIAADIIYVPMYIGRDLRLTAALYAGLLVLCVLGLRSWHRALGEQRSVTV